MMCLHQSLFVTRSIVPLRSYGHAHCYWLEYVCHTARRASNSLRLDYAVRSDETTFLYDSKERDARAPNQHAEEPFVMRYCYPFLRIQLVAKPSLHGPRGTGYKSDGYTTSTTPPTSPPTLLYREP